MSNVLRLVQTEDSCKDRQSFDQSIDACITLNGNNHAVTVIDTFSFGEIIISMASKLSFIVKGELVSIDLKDPVLFGGLWRVHDIRENDERCIINLRHEFYDFAIPYKSYLGPEIFYKENQIHLMHEKNELSQHITELKDSPIRPKAAIKDQTRKGVQAKWNFSNQQIALDAFEFESNTPEVFRPGQEILVEYNFLAKRFLFLTKVREIDSDFGLIITELPEYFLTINRRLNNRISCNLPALDSGNGEAQTLISYSPKALLFAGPTPKTGSNIIIKFANMTEVTLKVKITHDENKWLGFPTNTRENANAMRHLFLKCMPDDIKARDQNDHEKLLGLFEQVGYDFSATDSKWREKSIQAWSCIDEEIQGTTLSKIESSGKYIASCGVFPHGKFCFGPHSGCMIKSMDAASGFFEILNYIFNFSEYFEHTNFFFASYSKKSKMTSRMYHLYDQQSNPSEFYLFHALTIFNNSQKNAYNKDAPADLRIEYVSHLDAKLDSFHENIQKVARIVGEPQDYIPSLKITWALLFKNQEVDPVALVHIHDSPAYSSSIDLYNSLMIWVKDPAMSTAIVSYLLAQPNLKNKVINLIEGDGSEQPNQKENEANSDQAFYSLTHKRDLNILAGSISRTAWQVLRKYGEDALYEMEKICL